jgi:UDP-GlcNAc3NAcA epimerase
MEYGLKILSVIGARPQFVKAATISRALQQRGIQEIIVHTGQHFERNMSDIFFEEMDIPKPNYFLNIGGLSHGAMTGQMIEKIEEVLKTESPDVVLVYGDTNSTLAGALAAAKLHIPIAHVEAGLRSFNMKMPEEINRILTDRISSKLYCPTQTAVNNLAREGFQNFPIEISLVGDVMYDAALYYEKKAETLHTLEKLSLEKNNFFLCTFHRAENTDNLTNLKSIVEVLNNLSLQSKVVLPLHPRTRKILDKERIEVNFTTIDPVGYFDMINLIKNCRMVLTDSGGLQKEAYFFGKFCVTVRKETEWIELVEGGYNRLAGSDMDSILSSVALFESKHFEFSEPLFGTGDAAGVIADDLVRWLKRID